MITYFVHFERWLFSASGKAGITENVWVILETNTPCDNDHIVQWEEEAWNALWKQYPIWLCPFNQSNPTKTPFDKLRYGWSTPFLKEHKLSSWIDDR